VPASYGEADLSITPLLAGEQLQWQLI
jgi:hypothetical protein